MTEFDYVSVFHCVEVVSVLGSYGVVVCQVRYAFLLPVVHFHSFLLLVKHLGLLSKEPAQVICQVNSIYSSIQQADEHHHVLQRST